MMVLVFCGFSSYVRFTGKIQPSFSAFLFVLFFGVCVRACVCVCVCVRVRAPAPCVLACVRA